MNLSRNSRIGIAAVAVAAIPITAVSLQPTNAASGSGAPETIRLVERHANFRFIDLPPKAPAGDEIATIGDEFVFTARLFRSGKRVGTLHAVCTFTKRSTDFRTNASCVGTFALRSGRIEVQIGGLLGEEAKLAITGGTGKFAGANGTISSTTVGNKTIDIVHLMP